MMVYKVVKLTFVIQNLPPRLVTLLIYKVLKHCDFHVLPPICLVTLLIYKVLKLKGLWVGAEGA